MVYTWLNFRIVNMGIIYKVTRETRTLMSINRKRAWEESKNCKVGLIGGAFSPITDGHINLAKFVLSSGIVDKVLFIPCFNHVYGKELPSFQHRYNMCKIALKEEKKMFVSDIEYKHKLPGDTFSLIKKLLSMPYYRRSSLYFIIGTDNANTFKNWINYKELERLVCFIVVERQGIISDSTVNWYHQKPHVFLKNTGVVPEISSTLIRNWIRDFNLESLREFLHPKVLEYIQIHNLYREID